MCGCICISHRVMIGYSLLPLWRSSEVIATQYFLVDVPHLKPREISRRGSRYIRSTVDILRQSLSTWKALPSKTSNSSILQAFSKKQTHEQPRILSLALSIHLHTNEINDYLQSSGLPQPSTCTSSAAHIPLPPSLAEAQATIIEACTELAALIEGPLMHLTTITSPRVRHHRYRVQIMR